MLHYFAYVISEKMYKKHFGKMKDEDSGDCDDDQDDDDDDDDGSNDDDDNDGVLKDLSLLV